MDGNWRVHVNNTVAFQGYYTKVGIIDRKCNRRTIRDEHLHEPRRYDLRISSIDSACARASMKSTGI